MFINCGVVRTIVPCRKRKDVAKVYKRVPVIEYARLGNGDLGSRCGCWWLVPFLQWVYRPRYQRQKMPFNNRTTRAGGGEWVEKIDVVDEKKYGKQIVNECREAAKSRLGRQAQRRNSLDWLGRDVVAWRRERRRNGMQLLVLSVHGRKMADERRGQKRVNLEQVTC